MTLLAPEEARAERPVPHTGGVRRWWRSWRVSLRIARRDAWRDKWRSLLVVVLVFAPVAVLTTVDVYHRTNQVAESSTYRSLLALGRQADALVVASYDGPMVQSLDATNYGPAADIDRLPDLVYPGGSSVSIAPEDGDAPPSANPTAPTFPATWHVVPQRQTGVTAVVGTRAWHAEAVAADTRYPLAASRFDVSEGRLPNRAGEVAVSRALADAARIGPGSPLTVVLPPSESPDSRKPLELSIVGVADATDKVGATSLVVAPGPLNAANSQESWLADSPAPLTWHDVRALNVKGLVVASRAVLTDPPTSCRAGQPCLDAGPARPLPGTAGLGVRPEEAMVLALVAVLALLQVALLAGPAFAVSLRRRQRDLALVAANGGTGADLRRSILSSAVVLGTVAGAAAVAVAVLGIRFAAPWLARWGGHVPLPPPVVRPEVVGLAAVAVLAALCAAYVPARIAARTDTLQALRGRRPSGPVRRRVTWAGLCSALLGSALIVWGVVAVEVVSVVIGVLALQAGLILLVPWLLTITGRLGARLPVTLRLATRDSVRSRLRTVSAVSAITAATIGSTVALVATASYTAGKEHFYTPRAAPGVVLVTPYGDGGSAPADVSAALAGAVPGSTVASVEIATPDGDDNELAVQRRPPGCSGVVVGGMVVDEEGAPLDVPDPSQCYADGGSYYELVRADPTWVAALTGTHDPDVAQALRRGEAVVLDSTVIGADGKVRITSLSWREDGAPIIEDTIAIPAHLVPGPTALSRVVLPPGRTLPGTTFETAAYALIPPEGSDSTVVEAAVRGAMYEISGEPNVDGELGYEVYVERGYVDDSRLLLLALVGGTALLALIAALSVTALALADARPDLATMAAVGAPPRARRRFAAATGLLVAGLGCCLGIVAAIVPAWAIARTIVVGYTANDAARPVAASEFFTLPWPSMLLLGIGIPLVTAGVAWIFTRSRVPLTRRAD